MSTKFLLCIIIYKENKKKSKERKYWVHPILREGLSLQVAAGGGLSAPTFNKCEQHHSYSYASEIRYDFFLGVEGWQAPDIYCRRRLKIGRIGFSTIVNSFIQNALPLNLRQVETISYYLRKLKIKLYWKGLMSIICYCGH